MKNNYNRDNIFLLFKRNIPNAMHFHSLLTPTMFPVKKKPPGSASATLHVPWYKEKYTPVISL